MIRCPGCGGGGKSSQGSDCPMCNGCGEVPLPEIMKERARCAELIRRSLLFDSRHSQQDVKDCIEAILKGTKP